MNRKAILVALVLFLAGLALGWVAGRWRLETQWQEPRVTLSPEAATKSAEADADPTPGAGTQVFRPMPIQKTREALRAWAGADPVSVTVGAVGRNDDKAFLHLTLRNGGKCKVVGYRGVAYGFDAWGRPSRMNRRGEHYVAFEGKVEPVEPGGSVQHESLLRHADVASLAVAHVDHVACAEGPAWTRVR